MRRRLVIDRPVERPERDFRGKPRPKPRAEPLASPKERAQELVDRGMPYQMAMAVVHGKMELNEALERLSRRDRVNQLMERHQLSRALATQVAIGHADLKLILSRRRMNEHRETNRDRTVLVPGAELALGRFEGDLQRVRLVDVDAYTVRVEDPEGNPSEVHKLSLKYAYPPDDWKRVRKAMKRDKSAPDSPGPARRPQDRYTCSDKRLFSYVDSQREVVATLLDGDVFRGTITWFSRYEFGIKLKTEAEVVIFRHALADLSVG